MLDQDGKSRGGRQPNWDLPGLCVQGLREEKHSRKNRQLSETGPKAAASHSPGEKRDL